MNKLYYPVVLHPEETGYSVSVPDLDGCFSQGETLGEAVEMIQDAIGLFLDGETTFPAPSEPSSIKVHDGDILMVVAFDELAYKRKYDTKSVKKTLTIPSWLNQAAESAHINFSSVLQAALKQQLHIAD